MKVFDGEEEVLAIIGDGEAVLGEEFVDDADLFFGFGFWGDVCGSSGHAEFLEDEAGHVGVEGGAAVEGDSVVGVLLEFDGPFLDGERGGLVLVFAWDEGSFFVSFEPFGVWEFVVDEDAAGFGERKT